MNSLKQIHHQFLLCLSLAGIKPKNMNPHLRNLLFIWSLIAIVALMGTSCKSTVCPAYSKGYQKKQNDRFYASKKDPRTEHYRKKEKPSLVEWVWYGR